MALRSRWLVLCSVLLVGGFVVHCSASDESDQGAASGSGGRGDAGQDSSEYMPDVHIEPDGAAEAPYHESCGVVTCVPDRFDSCSGLDGSGAAPSGAGSGGGGGDAGSSGAGGGANGEQAGQGGAAGDGGSGGSADSNDGAAGSSSTAGAGAGGAEQQLAEFSCQVVLKSAGPRAECLPAGSGEVDAPCFSSGDCQAGLACVNDGAAGRCLPFCCAGDSSCLRGNYCAERQLADAAGSELAIPVCVPADDCSLNEPYPCEGGGCTCPEGEACMVVRADGTTTCAEPGDGEVGDPCPCAWGYVCSQATQQCVLLCETTRAEFYCGNAQCQASAELPEGWGVCVGPEPDAAAR